MSKSEEQAFPVSPELQAAVEQAIATVKARPSAKRHPFGKMINCPVCKTRHREVGQTAYVERFNLLGKKIATVEQVATKCLQKFTHIINGYEVLKESIDADGNVTLVPDLRTFGQDGERPTRGQVMGSPRKNGFSSNRIKPHPSKMKLLFIQKTREAFTDLGFSLEEPDKEKFSKNLQAARQEAARRIRADHKAKKSFKRFVREHTCRINRGLEFPGSRYVNRDRTVLLNGNRVAR